MIVATAYIERQLAGAPPAPAVFAAAFLSACDPYRMITSPARSRSCPRICLPVRLATRRWSGRRREMPLPFSRSNGAAAQTFRRPVTESTAIAGRTSALIARAPGPSRSGERIADGRTYLQGVRSPANIVDRGRR